MSKWSEEAARRSRERQQNNIVSNEKSVQDKNILDSKGRALFAEVRSVIGKKCEEFNAEPDNTGTLSFVGTSRDFYVSCTGHRGMIGANYEQEGHTIQFAGKNGVQYAGEIYVRLSSDGLDVWLSDALKRPVDIDRIANDIIETLLKATGR